jgi:hypothetical protein
MPIHVLHKLHNNESVICGVTSKPSVAAAFRLGDEHTVTTLDVDGELSYTGYDDSELEDLQ